MPRHPAALVLLLAACGDYVSYDETVKRPAASAGSDRAADAGARPTVTRLDHLAFGALLAKFVVPAETGPNLVDYAALSADDEALRILDQYLDLLGDVHESDLDTGTERLAFWLDAYDAIVLRAVVDGLGRDPGYSTADGDFAVFRSATHRISQIPISLDEIDHGVIRGAWDDARLDTTDATTRKELMAFHADLWGDASVDPRIHMGLNCAAWSCPEVQREAYTATRLDAQLDEAARRFLADRKRGAGPDGISLLFDWFRADFERDGESVDAFIAAHREGGLDGVDTGKFLPYDWSLNAAP